MLVTSLASGRGAVWPELLPLLPLLPLLGVPAGALATIEVLVLLALIVATIAAFRRCSRLAALLLAPYLLWVGFASALTWTIWRSNPGLL